MDRIELVVGVQDDEFANWTCDRCQSEYRWIEVKQPIAFLSDPERKQITVCATCHQELYRTAKGQFVEYH